MTTAITKPLDTKHVYLDSNEDGDAYHMYTRVL